MTGDAQLARQIKIDYRQAGLSARDRAMLDYVDKLARERWTITPDDHARLRAEGFTDADILDITLVVANFMLANTLTDAFGLEYHENLNAIFLEGTVAAAEEIRPGAETWVGRARPVVRALEGEEVVWLNSSPLTFALLRGHPVLVYHWDWTHPGSLEGLPYLAAWHERYAGYGLAVVLVLAPEFPFAKTAAAAERAVRRLRISLPVALDPEFRTWRGANNTFWPAVYLIDHQGTLRFRHHGPGGYVSMETEIQALIRERYPAAQLPEVAEPQDPRHRPGARLLEPTPQIYAVYEKGRLANREADGAEDRTVEFEAPETIDEGMLSVRGRWRVRPEGLELAGGRGTMTVRYHGAGVVAVLGHPEGSGRVTVRLDGADPAALAGRDVRDGVVQVTEPGMYALVDGAFGRHELQIETDTVGLTVYCLTFLPAPAGPHEAWSVVEVD